MTMAMNLLEPYVELYGWCTNTTMTGPSDAVHMMRLYRVARFVDDNRFFPHGVIVKDYRGNELTETFYSQQFYMFFIYLN